MKFDLIAWIKNALNFLQTEFQKLIQELLNRKEIIQFMADAGEIVKAEVLKADELDIPGDEKYEIAFKAIEDALKASGKSFAKWLINWAIENVVASIRTKLA